MDTLEITKVVWLYVRIVAWIPEIASTFWSVFIGAAIQMRRPHFQTRRLIGPVFYTTVILFERQLSLNGDFLNCEIQVFVCS
jgi:hypothetical protein